MTAAAALAFAVAVTTAAATAFTVSAATAAFAAAVLMAVLMTALGGGRLIVGLERLSEGRNDRFVGVAADARDEEDARARELAHRAFADAAADDAVDLVVNERPHLGAVAGARGFDEEGVDDALLFNVVDLEGRGHAEVLIDVFVLNGDCDSHDFVSCEILHCQGELAVLPAAAARAVARARSAADFVVAAPNDERAAVDDRVGDLVTGPFVDFGDGRARNPHLRGALFVRAPLVVHDPQGFVLLDEKEDGIDRPVLRRRIRTEGFNERLGADAPASTGSRHEACSLAK